MPDSQQHEQNSQESLHSIRIDQGSYIKKNIVSNNSGIKMQQDQSQQYSQQGEEQQHFESLANFPSTQQFRKKSMIQKKSEISNFIIKTYRILEDPINSDIIQWTDEGNAFIVKNKDKFENQILPKYFKHKKFSSFVRQLNMYDFHKIRKEKQIPIFKHKYFRQGCVDLLAKIKRKSGEQGIGTMMNDDDDAIIPTTNNIGQTKNYIPSLVDLAQKPMISAYSFKSKSHIPYGASMIPSQPSIGLLPGSGTHGSQLDLLLQQNNQLIASISDLTKEQAALELQKEKKKEKLTKMLSILLNFNLNGEEKPNRMSVENSVNNYQQKFTLRDLQNHFMSDEEPLSFAQYTKKLRLAFKNVKSNLVKMGNIGSDQIQENKIDEQ